MQTLQKLTVRHCGIAVVGLSIAALVSGFAPPPGKGGGGGKDKDKDNTPPAAVTDLAVFATTHRSIAVVWTATGDDGIEGVATEYDLRYSFDPITESNWDLATRVAAPTPGLSGSVEMGEVGNLLPDLNLFIAIRVVDDNDNISPVSNVVFASTDPAPATPWVVSPVWEDGQSGDVEIAMDPATGFPSIAFMHRSPADEISRLHFARWNGASWDIELVTDQEEGQVFGHQYDPISGLPVIVYSGQTKFLESVNLAWHDGGQWQTEFVDQTGINANASLAFDLDGTLTIAYWRRFEPKGVKSGIDDVVIARRIGATWDVELVIPDTVARQTSLVYHPVTGLPLLAFGEGSSEIQLATFDDELGQWLTENVPINLNYRGVELAIEPLSGEPAVTALGVAELCTRTSPGIWNCEVYHPDGLAGRSATLLFADDGTPIIAHLVGAGSTKKVALFSFRDNQTGLWIHEEIHVNGYVENSLSMTPTSWGTFFVSFDGLDVDGVSFEGQDLLIAERVGN